LPALPAQGIKLYLKGSRCHTDKCAVSKRSFAPASTVSGAPAGRRSSACSFARSRRSAGYYGVRETQFRKHYQKRCGVAA